MSFEDPVPTNRQPHLELTSDIKSMTLRWQRTTPYLRENSTSYNLFEDKAIRL